MQENLLRTMIQIENSFFALAEASERNCLVICDRGTMDASAFVSKQEWDEILQRNMCDEVDIRDNRYHQVRLNSPHPTCGVFSMNSDHRLYTWSPVPKAQSHTTPLVTTILIRSIVSSYFSYSQNTTVPDLKA